MNKQLQEKVKEALSSVGPITFIVLVLSIMLVPMSTGIFIMFLAGAALLVLGMGVFTLGVDMSMLPMGEAIGERLSTAKQFWLALLISFGMGAMITVAEPDLAILASQISSIPNIIMISTVAVGVGLFMVVSVVRVFFNIPLSRMLLIFYGFVFLLSIFVPNTFLSVAFDSGGVTTGPITVPFILGFGVGLASNRGGKQTQDDSFGTVALCSVGPILTVLLLGIVYDPGGATYAPVVLHEVDTTQDVAREFLRELPAYLHEVTLAVTPIIAAFILFQLFTRKYKKRQLRKIAVGFTYTFLGLIMFLTGVNVGFLPVGNLLGSEIAASPYKWLLIPLGMLIGFFIVLAEPAVHVLNKQVEDISGGTITAKAVQRTLSFGVAVSLGIAMLRVLTGISIYWFLVPGYLLSLSLSFFVPKIFTGIAFDSGGVASGPMTSTFLLPFAMGACEAHGGNVFTDAFGIVAMVAMTPLIGLQILGLVHNRNTRTAANDEAVEAALVEITENEEDEITEFDDSEIEYATQEELDELSEIMMRR